MSVAGVRYPRNRQMETGMITSRCYILELHALLRTDDIVLIIHPKFLFNHLQTILPARRQY
jgi:hypothetical protein